MWISEPHKNYLYLIRAIFRLKPNVWTPHFGGMWTLNIFLIYWTPELHVFILTQLGSLYYTKDTFAHQKCPSHSWQISLHTKTISQPVALWAPHSSAHIGRRITQPNYLLHIFLHRCIPTPARCWARWWWEIRGYDGWEEGRTDGIYGDYVGYCSLQVEDFHRIWAGYTSCDDFIWAAISSRKRWSCFHLR